MARLDRVIRTLASLQTDIAALAALLILLQVTTDLVLRYAFDNPIRLSTEIVAYYYMVPLIFLPLLRVEYYDHHITTDLFFARFPRRVQGIFLILGSVLTLVLYAVLAWFSLKGAMSGTAKGEVVMGARLLPIWPMRWVLPVAFVLAAFGAALTMIRRIQLGPDATIQADEHKEPPYE